MKRSGRMASAAAALSLALTVMQTPAHAQKQYDPGASDTEIRIGNTAPFSGPASAYQEIAKSLAAYFDMVNAKGGINGRKIKFITLDDGYSPPKTVEATRRLVEEEQVLLTAGSIGTGPQLAVQKYMNQKKVPQLFAFTGSARFFDPQHYPYSIGYNPSYATEGRVIGKYLVGMKPAAKVAVFVPADDAGKDYMRGFKEGIATSKDAKIVGESTYSTSDATVDSQVTSFQAAGADVFFDEGTPKFAAQGIAKAYDIGWKPVLMLPTVSASVASVLKPAGLDKSTGVLSPALVKDPTDPKWDNDPEKQAWLAWMKQYNPSVGTGEIMGVQGYVLGALIVEVLKRCGDTLTHDNIIKQATSLTAVTEPMLLPGVRITITPTDYQVFRQFQFQRFNGKTWDQVGTPVNG
jgi:branched-chain amino acid transport system substrate-binding protein